MEARKLNILKLNVDGMRYEVCEHTLISSGRRAFHKDVRYGRCHEKS
jgi:hypothetical protein